MNAAPFVAAARRRAALFVVVAARVDHAGAVDLFQEHDAHEVVREGHVRKGEQQVGRRLDARVQPAGGTDDEGDLAPRGRERLHVRGQALAGQLFALHRQNDAVAAHLAQHRVRLLGGAAPLGQLAHVHFGKARKALAVFVHGVGVKFFFELADADDADFLHVTGPR